MKIEFDPRKNEANCIKHGVSLAEAIGRDFDQAIVIEDRRFDYGETRFLACAPIGGRLHVAYYTMRGDVLGAIGLRKANKRERRRFGQAS